MSKVVETLAWFGRQFGKPPGWERIVRLMAPPEKFRGCADVSVIRDDSIFFAQLGVVLGWNVAFFGTFEPEVRDVIRSVLPTGGVGIDIGANVGWHTLLMARVVGEGGRVLAAEANPSVRERLEMHLRVNRLHNVEVAPFAITDSVGTVDFVGPDADDPFSGDGHIVSVFDIRPGGTINVEARTLDAIVFAEPLNRVDLIKIDVEGFEWPVLKGAERTLAAYRPQLLFEFDAAYATRGGGTPAILHEYFKNLRYTLFALRRSWAELIDVRTWPTYADIWAIPDVTD